MCLRYKLFAFHILSNINITLKLKLRKAACFSYLSQLGLLSEPKWGHLKDLHAAIKLCEPALVAADSPQYIKLGPKQEVCAVFSAFMSIFQVWYVRQDVNFSGLLQFATSDPLNSIRLWGHAFQYKLLKPKKNGRGNNLGWSGS